MAAELTRGDLDPTMGAELVGLGYDRPFTEVPASDEPATATPQHAAVSVRQAAKWSDVELDIDNRTLRVPAGVVLDLGATAKARCADLSAARIAAACGGGVLVSLGGGASPWLGKLQPAAGWYRYRTSPATRARKCRTAVVSR